MLFFVCPSYNRKERCYIYSLTYIVCCRRIRKDAEGCRPILMTSAIYLYFGMPTLLTFPLPPSSKRRNMGLPVIKTAVDCTDFTKTVLPYISQLYDLPHQIFENVTNLEALKSLYISTNPLISAFAFSLFLFPIFLVVSEINKNYSQVDRWWSLLPTIYNAHYVTYAHLTGLPTKRLDTLLFFSVIWSVSYRSLRSCSLLIDNSRRV